MEQDGGSSLGSSITSESISQSLRSGATSLTGASASTASRMTISSFCSSQMELDESRPIPREVRHSIHSKVAAAMGIVDFVHQVQEIAKYLGISAESLSTPVTPQVADVWHAPPITSLMLHVQEVHDMAEYLGINILTEGFLLPLAKMSLQARTCGAAVALRRADPNVAAGAATEKLGNI